MKKYNVIVIFDENKQNILMCSRKKNPYIGKLNFIGGKIEPGEDSSTAAYRELYEETAILPEDIRLIHFMNIEYLIDGNHLEVFYGSLNKYVSVFGEENELVWCSASEDFSDLNKYAGDGNISHILRMINKQSATIEFLQRTGNGI